MPAAVGFLSALFSFPFVFLYSCDSEREKRREERSPNDLPSA